MKGFDQAKMVLQMKKAERDIKNHVVTVEQGDGAVKIEMTGDQRIKKVTIDPEYVDIEDIRQLERWIEDGLRDALQESKTYAAEKVQPYLGSLGNMLGM